jgi:serine/threonine protein kinase
VDYKNQLFSVTWQGTQDYPDFGKFPSIDHGSVTLIQQHPDIAAIWEDSAFLDYGAHASVRISKNEQFPVFKLSHNDELSLQLMQHELDALVTLSGLGYHIADFNKQPIQVTGIIYGYRMKRLYKLDVAEMQSRAKEIRKALYDLHSAGYCHGDLNPSNIMKDDDGRITIIDFSFAGRIGDKCPSYFPSYVYPDGVYDANGDLAALDRYIGGI